MLDTNPAPDVAEVALTVTGQYYAEVTALSGAGTLAEYILEARVTDPVPPRVVLVEGLPQGARRGKLGWRHSRCG